MSSSERHVNDEQAILRAQQETMAAIRDKDADKLRQLIADEFVHRTAGGAFSDVESFLEAIATLPVKIHSVEGDGLRVSLFGDFAVLTGIQRATYETPAGETGVDSSVFTDVLTRRDGRWLLVLAHDTPLATQE